jgi:hypothetical protein
MGLELLLVIIRFADICMFSIGSTHYLIAIEEKESTKKSSEGILLSETNWHIFKNPSPNKPAEEIQVFAPSIGAVDLIARKETLWAAIENNSSQAAYLLKWNMVSTDPFRIIDLKLMPIIIPQNIMASVNVPGKDSWSTLYLPPERWLFNPHLSMVGDNPAICLNTADARALCMEYSPSTKSFKAHFDYESLIEPVAITIDSKNTLLGRIVSKPWSVFFNTSRYSAANGPRLLPIGYVDSARRVIIDLSHESGLGPVYSFDAFESVSGRKVLALVSGIKEKPIVSVVVFNKERNKWITAGSINLPAIPIRCKLNVNEKGVALVGIVIKEKTGYAVYSWTVETGKI